MAGSNTIGNVSDFLEAIAKLGFDDFHVRESYDQPHKLQSVTMTEENYRGVLFGNDVLKRAYQEDTYVNPPPEHEWFRFRSGIEETISAHGPETRAAFGTLLTLCKKYAKSVHDLPIVNGCRYLSKEKNGFSDEEAARFGAALSKIWAAYPDTDPRIIEGFDYVMSSTPMMKEAFPRYWFQGNEHRSDYQLARKMEKSPVITGIFNHAVPSDKVAPIARQSAENLAQLKAHAPAVAEKVLAWALSRIYELDKDWRDTTQSRSIARVLLNAIENGDLTTQSAVKLIQAETYGDLKGTGKGTKNDAEREQALASAQWLPQILGLACSVNDGSWFDREQQKLLQLADDISATKTKTSHRPVRRF